MRSGQVHDFGNRPLSRQRRLLHERFSRKNVGAAQLVTGALFESEPQGGERQLDAMSMATSRGMAARDWRSVVFADSVLAFFSVGPSMMTAPTVTGPSFARGG